jgi:hypothetical protein
LPTPRLEAFLARLYVDASLRQAFLADPRAVLAKADLDASEREGLLRIDREGLEQAARALAAKRTRPAASTDASR